MKALDIKKKVLNGKTQGFAIKIIYEMKDDFKKRFPSAKWNSDEKVWEVGPRSGKRLEAWRDANVESYLSILQKKTDEIENKLCDIEGEIKSIEKNRASDKEMFLHYKLESLKKERERVKEIYAANNNNTDAKKIKEVRGRSLVGVSINALKDREVAKLFGGYALVGNKKDKELGEKVRAQKIKGFKRAQSAEYFCDKENQTFQSAKFWIHNINRHPEEFEGFIDTLAKLDEKVAKARKSVKTEVRKMGKTRYCPIKKEHERYFVDVEIILDSKEYDAAVKEREEFLEEWGA